MAEIDLRDQNNVRDMLPHKPMRLSMENKNLLSKKGDIYVGTGGTQTVNIEDDTYKIAETTKVSVPPEVISSNESAILIYDKTNNLQYKKSSESGFVTYGVEQGLNDEQKITARKNIGAAAVSDLTFVSYMVEQGLNDGQKITARNNIGAAAVSDLTFLSYTTNQIDIIKDLSGEETGPKTTLLKNIFDGLTNNQKNYVRSQIDAGSAQGVAGITAGNGIKVDSNTPSSPRVSVNLAQNSGMEFYSNQLKLKIGDGISVSNGAISVNLAQNSGLVFDSSSPKGLKLNVNSSSQSGNKYWVQIDSDNHPYVNVSVPSSDNQRIAYAPDLHSLATTFGDNSLVKLVPGNNISMDVDTNNDYIQINATQYSAAVGGGIKLDGTSFSLNTGNVTGEKKYAVQLENGIPYVNVPWTDTTYTAGAGLKLDEATHTLSIERYSYGSNWSGLTFGTNSNGKRGLMLNAETVSRDTLISSYFDLRIDENNVPYTYIPGYVPIEYKSSASSTAGFTSDKLYLIGTWGGV